MGVCRREILKHCYLYFQHNSDNDAVWLAVEWRREEPGSAGEGGSAKKPETLALFWSGLDAQVRDIMSVSIATTSTDSAPQCSEHLLGI